MSTESYSGIPIPDGWTRIRTGVIQPGDRALSDGAVWTNLPDRYAGAGVGMFCCVIRRVAVDRKETIGETK